MEDQGCVRRRPQSDVQAVKEMDTFEKALPTLGKKAEELRAKCICPDCPTYNDCSKERNELLFCIYGKSFQCITEDLGCICPGCPLIEELGLVNLTFCLLGSEASQRFGLSLNK